MNEDQDVKVNPDVAPEIKETLEETAAPVETAFATPATTTKRRPLKLIIAALIVAVIVVLIGGSVFGYTMWYQNPNKVVHDAILSAIKAKTVSSTGTITYTGDDLKMNITLDSKLGEGSGEFTVGAKVTIDTEEMQQDFDTTGTGRIVNDVFYVKLSGIKSIVEDTATQSSGKIPSYAASIFESIEDRWISIKASDYQNVNEDISTQQTCFIDLMEKMQSNKSMADEVADVYQDNQIIVIKENLGTKDVKGTSSLGYKVEVNKEAAASFVSGLEETSFGKEIKACNEDVNFNEIAKDINQEVSENKDMPVSELWVSKFSHEITEIAVYGNTNGKDALNIILQPTFNKNVTVEAPEDATSLEAVLEEIQQTITEYYSGIYSPEALPSGSGNSGLDSQLQSAI